MEILQLSTLCFFTATVIFIAFMFFTGRSGSRNPISENNSSRSLPSPSELPIIGSLHHLFSSSPPHQRFRDLARRHGPLMRFRLLRADLLLVSSRDAAEAVLKAHDLDFASRPTVPGIKYTNVVFSPYGDYWRQMRRASTTELFTAQRVKSFAAVREHEISRLVEEIASASRAESAIDVGRAVRLASTAVVFAAAMGKGCRHQEAFVERIEEATRLGEGMSFEDALSPRKMLKMVRMKSKIGRLHAESDAIMDRMLGEIPEEKIEKPENVIQVLLRQMKREELGFPITLENIKAEFAGLFGAGTETSTATVEWAMSELIRKPTILAKVQNEVRHAMRGKTKLAESDIEELPFLKLVVKETLRLHPSIPLIPRECRESCRVLGHDIPAGQKVFVNAWAIGRDPDCWKDAECFNPERFEGSALDYVGKDLSCIPFGAGRRICPGMTFGVVFVELVLANLLFHFDWELPHGTKADELDMRECLWTACVRKSALYLVPKIHIPSPIIV